MFVGSKLNFNYSTWKKMTCNGWLFLVVEGARDRLLRILWTPYMLKFLFKFFLEYWEESLSHRNPSPTCNARNQTPTFLNTDPLLEPLWFATFEVIIAFNCNLLYIHTVH